MPDDGSNQGQQSSGEGQQQQNAGQQQGQQNQQQQTQAEQTPQQWFESLDPATKSLVEKWNEADVAPLKASLQTARTERDNFAKQIKDLAEKAKKGENLEAELSTISANLESANGRADFYETAISEKVIPGMLKAAWHYVQAEKVFDRYNRIDWARLKQESPGFFETERRGTQSNAGSGQGNQNGTPPAAKTTMNDLIRGALIR